MIDAYVWVNMTVERKCIERGRGGYGDVFRSRISQGFSKYLEEEKGSVEGEDYDIT